MSKRPDDDPAIEEVREGKNPAGDAVPTPRDVASELRVSEESSAEESGGGEGHRPGREIIPADRWRRIAGIVEVALELDTATRAAYLEMLGRSNEEMRWQVLSVLRSLGVVQSEDSHSEPILPAALLSQDRIGPWRIVRLLGRGGMGAVFLAERDDEEYERQVAIKVISAGFEAPIVYRRFLAERQILAGFDHPNIARLLDGGTAQDGRPFLVMEYVDGVPIDRFCFESELDLTSRLKIFRKVCAAVSYAHRQLVVHRDLKPSNILVTNDGEPKLLDFGIAKLLNADSRSPNQDATHTANAVLTPKWASPEQLRGESIATSTDVYTLGLLLYKLLTGSMPYGGPRTLASALDGHSEPLLRPSREVEEGEESTTQAWPRTPPRLVAQRLRGDLDNIVLKALRFEPERRYASVADLDGDLERFLAGRPVSATRDTVPYLARKFISLYRWQVLAAAIFVAAILTIASVALIQAEAVRKERDQTELARQTAEGQARRAEASQAFLADLLRAADETERQKEELSVRDLLSKGVERIEGGAIEEPKARVDLLRLISEAFIEFRDFDTSLRTLELAASMAEEAGMDPPERAILWGDLANLQAFSNDFLASARSCEQALEVAPVGATEIRLGCLRTLRYSYEVHGDLKNATETSRRVLDTILQFDDRELRDFLAEEGDLFVEFVQLGEIEEALSWARRIAQLWRSEEESPPPNSFFLMVLLVESRDYAAADRLSRLRFGGKPYHDHDVYAANTLIVWIDALIGLGEYEEALAKLGDVDSTADAMLNVVPGDLRARYLKASAHYRRGAIWRLRGEASRLQQGGGGQIAKLRQREIESALELIQTMRGEEGFFLPIERLYLETLLESDRLELAKEQLDKLVAKGFNRRRTLRQAAAKGLQPTISREVPIDASVPPRIQEIFDAVAHVELPWEQETTAEASKLR